MYGIIAADSPHVYNLLTHDSLNRNAEVLNLPWGTISKSNEINLMLETFVPYLNSLFLSNLQPSDFSIALGEAVANVPHGLNRRSVPYEYCKRDRDGKPLPVRLIVPLSGALNLNVGDKDVYAALGDIVAIPNDYPYNFYAIPDELSGHFSFSTQFLIIDAPSFNINWEFPVS